MKIHALVLAGSLGLVASMGGLTGCASSDRSFGGRIDDMSTARKVKGALKDSTVYKFDQVNVNSYNGVVQLSGWVTSDQQKAKATEIAQRVPGVRDVVNNISLKPRAAVGSPSPTSQSQTGTSSNTQSSDQADRLQEERNREEQLRQQQLTP